MPHYRCPPCRTRQWLPPLSPGEIGRLCPDCGSLLEPVSELVQLVGFRAPDRSPSEPAGHEAVTVRIEELLVRRALVREHNRQQAILAAAVDGGPEHPPAAAAATLAVPS